MEKLWQIESKNHPSDPWFVSSSNDMGFTEARDLFNKIVSEKPDYEFRLVEVTKEVFHYYSPERGY